MRVTVRSYNRRDGFSAPLPPEADHARTLVLLFGAASFEGDDEPFRSLRAVLPSSHVLGCSTAGEILEDKVSDDSVVIAIVEFAATTLRSTSARVASSNDSRDAAMRLAEALDAPDLRAVLVLSDGKCVNGSELASGLNERFAGRVVVSGGLAGDGDRFERTWVLVEGEPRRGRIAAVGLYGDALHVTHGSRGGWDIFGPERHLTRANGNVLYEIDGRPALTLYKEYLGDRVAGLPATALLFPLAIRVPGTERRLVRTILDIDERTQSMVFAGDVPQGALGQLMRANFDRLVQGASDAAQEAADLDPDATGVSIAVSCVGRRLVLRQRVEEELQASRESMPPGIRQVGFYSYGELSPLASGRCELHNQTMTLTTLSERPPR